MNPIIRILHLEDTPTDAELAGMELKRAGLNFKKLDVDSKQAYIEALASFAPDIVISDHSLLSFDSLGALQILKESGLQIPFILVTSTISEEFAVEIMREGATDYILKDRMQRLPNAVLSALEKYRMETERQQFIINTIASENLLRNAERIAKIGSLYIDFTTQERIWSAGMDEILGYAPGEVGHSIDIFLERVHPDDRQRVNSEISHAIQHLDKVEFEYRIVTPANEVKFALSSLVFKRDQDGRALSANGFIQDITERKTAQIKLAAANENFKLLFNTIDEVFYSRDMVNDKLLQISPACESVYGYAVDEFLNDPELRFKILHKGDLQEQAGIINDLKKGKTVLSQYRIYHKTKGERWVESKIIPSLDANGTLLRLDGVTRDITARKEAEAMVEENNARILEVLETQTTILDALPPNIALLNEVGEIVAVNKSWKNFGMANNLQADNFGIGCNYISISEKAPGIDESDGDKIAQGIKDVIAGTLKEFTMEYPCDSPTEMRWFQVVVAPLNDHYRKGAVVLHINITDRRLSEEKLSRSEQRYREIVETAQEGIWVIDSNLTTVFVNKKMCDILGYAPDEIIGKHNYDFKPESDKPITIERLLGKEAGLIESHESVFITKTGKQVVCSVTTNSIFKPDGSYMGTLAMMTDITDRKAQEAALKRSEANLTAIIENTDASIFSLDRELRYVAFNQILKENIRKNYNIDIKPGDHVFDSLTGFFPGETEEWKSVYQKGMDGQPVQFIRQFGYGLTTIFYDFSINPIWENNYVIGLSCTVRDITRQKQDEIALARSEANLSAIIENTTDLVYSLNKDLQFITFNQQFKTTIKRVYGVDVAYGMKPSALFVGLNEAVGEKWESIYRKTLAGEAQQFVNEYEFEGNPVYLSYSVNPIIERGEVIGLSCFSRDITRQKLDEVAIIKSEANLRSVFENTDLAIVLFDNNFKVASFNHNAAQYALHRLNKQITAGMNGFDVFPHWSRESIINESIRKAKTGEVVTYEAPYTFDDGLFWFEVKWIGVMGAHKEVIGIILTVKNITEQKNAEIERSRLTADLLKSNQDLKLLESVVTNTIDSVMITDTGVSSDGVGTTIIYVNDAFTKMTGYKANEVIGRSPNLLHGPKTDPGELSRLLTAMANWQPCEVTIVNYKKSGEEYWVNFSMVPVADETGTYTHWIEIHRDITDKKRAEEHIKQLNERFSVISKATNVALMEWDFQQNAIWWSESHFELFGFDAKRGYPMREEWLARIQPESREFIAQINVDILQNKRESWQEEIKYYKPDNTRGVLLSRGFVIRDERRKPLRMLGSYIDITSQKDLEFQKVLLSEISEKFNENVGLQDCLLSVLELLVNKGNFCLTEFWLIDSDRKNINVAARFGKTAAAHSFIADTEQSNSYSKGVGLAGLAWENGRVEFWHQSVKNASFQRVAASERAGFKRAYSLPLFYNHEVIGALALIMDKDEMPDFGLATMFDDFSVKLGAEIKRKQLEDELNQIFNFSPDIICIAGTDGFFKKINPAMCGILEYSQDELLTRPFFDFLHPDDKNKTRILLNTIEGGQSTDYFENRYITKGGKTIWLAWTTNAASSDGLVFCVAKNITDKKELEELHNNATTLARIGGWEINVKKNALYWSEITREIHEVEPNFEPDNYLAAKFYKEGHDRELIIKMITDAIGLGTPIDVELQIITAKGNIKWIKIVGKSEFIDGQCVRVYGSIQDIDGRKKAEINGKQALEERNTILESIDDAFFAVDKNWVVTYWNNSAERVLGKNKSEMLDHKLWDVFSESVGSESYKQYHMAVATNQAMHFEDFYQPLEKWYEISAYPAETGLSVYFKDVTERKDAEQRLKVLNEDLRKHAKELATSNAELEQFAYVASHDLQEPLRMVTSFLTQLQKKYGEVIDDKGKQYIHFAVDGAKRMRQIILDLLDFSRVGKTEDDQEEVDINKLVNEILAFYRRHIEETQARVVIGKLPTILGYKTPLRQVLQNLIGNSFKYHKEGVPPVVEIKCKETKTHYQFTVTDNGIGISREYFDKIFVIFQRLHNKDEYSGTGMGLAIAKKIIENMGGQIWLESEEGKGTTFYFTILKNNKL